MPFDPKHSTAYNSDENTHNSSRGYNVIIFCHSMYSMPSKDNVVKRTLKLLRDTGDKVLVVFYCNGSLNLNNLICYQTAYFPTRVV